MHLPASSVARRKGVDWSTTKVYLVCSGSSSLAAAAFMIRDGGSGTNRGCEAYWCEHVFGRTDLNAEYL